MPRRGLGLAMPATALAVCLVLSSSPAKAQATYSTPEHVRLNNHAVKAINEKKFDEAVAILEGVLKSQPDYSIARENLAIAYYSKGLSLKDKAKEAADCLRRSIYYNNANPTAKRKLARLISSFGQNPKSFTDRIAIAGDCKAGGDSIGAIVEYGEALELRQNISPKDDPALSAAIKDCADLLRREHREAEAAQMEAKLSQLASSAAGVTSNWARTPAREAIPFFPGFEEDMLFFEKEDWLNSGDEVGSVVISARELLKDGNITDAAKKFEEAASIAQKTGSPPPREPAALSGLADCYVQQGRLSDAEDLYKRALEILNKTAHAEKSPAAATYRRLANLAARQNKPDDAARYYQKAVDIWEKSRGTESAELATGLTDLGLLHVGGGKYSQAEPFLKRAHTIWEQGAGAQNAWTATSAANLAICYAGEGKFDQAEELYSKARGILEKNALGGTYVMLTQVLRNQAVLKRKLNKDSDAAVLEALAAETEAKFSTGEPEPGDEKKLEPEVDFGPYMSEVQSRIRQKWLPPAGHETKRVVVRFKVHTNGKLSNLKVDESSGVPIADKAALNAVQISSPFQPLPEGAEENVDIQFTFDYNVWLKGDSPE